MRIENNSSYTRQNNPYENKKIPQQKTSVKYNKQNLMMFLSIFAVLLLIFLGLARIMSPDIDISLGDDNINAEQDEEYGRSVDSRLRMLQQDDEMNLLDHDEDASLIEDDGVVSIPKFEEKTMLKLEDEEPINTNSDKDEEKLKNENKQTHQNSVSTTDTEIPKIRQNNATPDAAPTAPTPQPTKTYRVYVGMYSSPAQAEVAKGILQDAGLGVAPSIKQAAGGYTLQVGAFNSKDSATNLTNKLLMNNYPARVVSD